MKKLLTFALCALLAISVFAVNAFAAEEPTLATDLKVYISFQTGDNILDGLTSVSPKKQFLTSADAGVVSLLKENGGTLVGVGKVYIGGDYTLEELGGPLLITSNDGETDFKNPLPDTNPECAMKLAKGATLTITSDVIIDDIILFQEHAEPTLIEVTNGATLVIGENIVCATNPNFGAYMGIIVRDGASAIVKGGTFQYVAGDGEIVINDGVTIAGEAPAELPAETTEAPVETTEAPVETTEAPVETTEAPVETTEAPVETTTAPAATEESGVNVPLIAGVAAVVVLVVIIAVVVTKKKKN